MSSGGHHHHHSSRAAPAVQQQPVTMEIMQRQLAKLSEEYVKVKEKSKVLKTAVKDEKRRNAELTTELHTCKKELRGQTAEVDSQTFHVQRLTKRVGKLQEQLDRQQEEAKQRAATSGSWMGLGNLLGGGGGGGSDGRSGGGSSGTSAAAAAPERVEEKFKVLRSELQLQIQENERVHIQMFQMQTDHKAARDEQRQEIQTLQGQLGDVHTQMADARAQYDEAMQEKAHQGTLAKRKIQELIAELSKARKEMTARETTMIASNQQVSSELQDIQRRYARKVNFDDTRDSASNALNLPPFNRDVVLRKCRLLDTLHAPLTALTSHMVFVVDTVSLEYGCTALGDGNGDGGGGGGGSMKASGAMVELWHTFLGELTLLRQTLRNTTRHCLVADETTTRSTCLPALAKFTDAVCVVLSRVLDAAASASVTSPLLDTLRQLLDALKKGNSSLSDAIERRQPCIPFYCDWAIDYLLMRAPSFIDTLMRSFEKMATQLEHMDEQHRKSMQHGLHEICATFTAVRAALDQYGPIRLSSSPPPPSSSSPPSLPSSSSLAAASSSSLSLLTPTNDDDASSVLSSSSHTVLVPAMDVDVSRLYSLYQRSHRYLDHLNSDDGDGARMEDSAESIPYVVAVRLHSELKSMRQQIITLTREHDESTARVAELYEECARLRAIVQSTKDDATADKEALEALTLEYASHVASLEQQLELQLSYHQQQQQYIGGTTAAVADDDASSSQAPPPPLQELPQTSLSTTATVTTDNNEADSAAAAPPPPPSAPAAAAAALALTSSPSLLRRSLTCPLRHTRGSYHAGGGSMDGGIDDATTITAAAQQQQQQQEQQQSDRGYRVLGVTELTANGWTAPDLDHNYLNQRHHHLFGGTHGVSALPAQLRRRHTRYERDPQLDLLRRQVAVADERAVKFHHDLQYLDRVLATIFRKHADANNEAKCASDTATRLASDMETTKENYERMMGELTEHVCKLTEQIAVADSRQRRRKPTTNT